MAKVKNLGDILPPGYQEMESQSAEEYFGKPLIFYASRELKGQNGSYKRIDVTLPEGEDHFVIACGAAQVMDVLNWAAENNAFPFQAQFVQAGRAIILKGVD